MNAHPQRDRGAGEHGIRAGASIPQAQHALQAKPGWRCRNNNEERFALDLTLIVPAFLIGAVLRWRGHPAGAVAGVAMNVLGVLYMAARAFAGGFQARAGISGKSWAYPPWIELAITSLAACWLLLAISPQAPARGAAPPDPADPRE